MKKKQNEQTSKTKEVQRIDEPFLQQKRKLGQFYAFISKKVQKRKTCREDMKKWYLDYLFQSQIQWYFILVKRIIEVEVVDREKRVSKSETKENVSMEAKILYHELER